MDPTRSVRRISQVYFLVLYLIAGYCFFLAIQMGPYVGNEALVYRFPAIEGFLPISALMGLKQLIAFQVFDPIHPAGLTILLLIIVSALLLKRSFCSHICPIGTISEYVYVLRSKIAPQQFHMPKALDLMLKMPKYFILAFLLYIVCIGMSAQEAFSFVRSPYNMIADAKMLYFFMDPSPLTIQVLAVLTALTLAVRNFWCRYLCPYGAFMNIAAFLAPVQLRKNESCISCRRCDSLCPSGLRISTAARVTSPECTLCQSCIQNCPSQALSITTRFSEQVIKPSIYSMMLLGLFAAGILTAKLTGHWDSTVLARHWVEILPYADLIGH